MTHSLYFYTICMLCIHTTCRASIQQPIDKVIDASPYIKLKYLEGILVYNTIRKTNCNKTKTAIIILPDSRFNLEIFKLAKLTFYLTLILIYFQIFSECMYHSEIIHKMKAFRTKDMFCFKRGVTSQDERQARARI